MREKTVGLRKRKLRERRRAKKEPAREKNEVGVRRSECEEKEYSRRWRQRKKKTRRKAIINNVFAFQEVLLALLRSHVVD